VTPAPVPAAAPVDRAVDAGAELVDIGDTDVVLAEEVVEEGNVDEVVLEVDSVLVLVAVHPLVGTENNCWSSSGAGAVKLSSVGSAQSTALSMSPPQHCHRPLVVLYVASGACRSRHLLGQPDPLPVELVQEPT
jgi:hypothetical protein